MSWGRFKKTSHKYGAKKVERAGYSFESKLEAAVFDLIKLRERAGDIADIQVQDSVYLTDARILYKPDFKVMCLRTNQPLWIEAKGYRTPEWQIKKRLWKSYGPGPLEIWEGSHSNPKLTETLLPNRGAEL